MLLYPLFEPVFIKTYETTGSISAMNILDGLLYILNESEGIEILRFDMDAALQASWQLDERSGSTTALDSSGNGFQAPRPRSRGH